MESVAIANFSKGMNNHVEPGKILPEMARLIKNARITTGALVPIKQPLLGNEQSNPEDLNHFGWINRSTVKWFDNYYWSINDADEEPYYGGNKYGLGIEPPTVTFLVTNSGQIFEPLEGLYKYCVTYVNADGWESAPQEYQDGLRYKTIYLNQELPNILVSKPVEDWVDKVNVYRTVGNGANFYRIRSFTVDELGQNFSDSTKDDLLLFNPALETYAMDLPPANGKFLTERDGYFYLAVGDKLYSSKNSNPHYWNSLNWIGFDSEITGITREYQGLLVFTSNRIWRVGGGDITNSYKQEIPVSQGCINYQTISAINNAPIWVSNDGICVWNGQNVDIITLNRLDFDTQATRFAVSANDRYHLFLTDGTCIVADMRSGNIFYKRDLDYEYGWYDADLDILYLCDVDPYMLYIDEAGSNDVLTYQSAVVPGDELILREYFRALIDGDGFTNITLYNEKDVGLATLAAHLSGRTEVLFPSGLQIRGLSIKLESSSTIRSIIIFYKDIGA